MSAVPLFMYEIVSSHGVLCYGCLSDFLITIQKARHRKAELQRDLPLVRVRVKLYYPNSTRVSRENIKAALIALSDKKVFSEVYQPMLAAQAPCAAWAQPASCMGSVVALFLVFSGLAFSQAGVVAPPDGLKFETLPILATACLPA